MFWLVPSHFKLSFRTLRDFLTDSLGYAPRTLEQGLPETLAYEMQHLGMRFPKEIEKKEENR
jgi:hypothetical protein